MLPLAEQCLVGKDKNDSALHVMKYVIGILMTAALSLCTQHKALARNMAFYKKKKPIVPVVHPHPYTIILPENTFIGIAVQTDSALKIMNT